MGWYLKVFTSKGFEFSEFDKSRLSLLFKWFRFLFLPEILFFEFSSESNEFNLFEINGISLLIFGKIFNWVSTFFFCNISE